MRLHLNIGQRLAFGFGLMLVLVLVSAGTGVLYTASVEDTVNATRNGVDDTQRIANLELAWLEIGATLDNMLLTRQSGLIEQRLNDQMAAFNQQLALLFEQPPGESDTVIAQNRAILDRTQPLGDELNAVMAEITTAAQESRWPRAQVLRHTDLASLQRRLGENLAQLSENIRADVNNSVAESVEAKDRIRTYWFVIAGLAVFAAAFAGYWATTSITRPVSTLVRTAESIEKGDLSQRAEIEGQDEIGNLAKTFNSMTDQLQEFIDHLEERVNARTRDLQIAADVSRQITTVLDIDALLQQVVTLTTQSFDLYAALVFRYDEETNTLVHAASTGADLQPGEYLGIEQIPLAAEPSVIALAARTQEAVTINDVEASPAFRYVPALPNTQSELAIPLTLGDRLLGVFDLQSQHKDHFSEDDRRVLTSLAEQIATAIRNAQLFAETERAREAAEQANRVKSQFLANMSHELRTPLNAILNFTGFVADGVLGPVNDQQADSLNKVIGSSEHLLSLINDILDLTKIEVGMMDLFIQDVDINTALDSALATAKGLVKDKPIDIIAEIDPDLPAISGDRRRIRQILLNLVSNAVKFTSEGSITLKAYRSDDMIEISVADTGVGIAPEQYDTVFATFQQANKHDLSDTPGTGLGMPITKAFVEAHGGRIWFNSEVGKGTTFFVTLPVTNAELVTAETETAQASNSSLQTSFSDNR